MLTQRIVSKSFSPGSGAVPRVRPLNLLLAEQDPFSAISSSPLSFIIMHSTLSNESENATHKPNIKSFTQVYISLPHLWFRTNHALTATTSLLGAGHGSCYVASLSGPSKNPVTSPSKEAISDIQSRRRGFSKKGSRGLFEIIKSKCINKVWFGSLFCKLTPPYSPISK